MLAAGNHAQCAFSVRLISGIFMLLASLDWFVDATNVLHQPGPVSTDLVQEQTV